MSNNIKKTQVFDISIAANSMSDSQGIINEVNAAFLRTWGFSNEDEVLGKHISYFLQSEEKAAEIVGILNKTGVWEGDYIAKKNDGSTFIAHGLATVLRDNDGKINGYQSSVFDITERQEIEDRLNESERRNLVWLENSPVCTKIVDLDFNLQYMSRAGLEALNISDPSELLGKPYPFDFYPESFKKTMTENLEKAGDTGKTITQEGAVFSSDGNEVWFHSTIVPVSDDDGQLDYFMVVSLDTTSQKRIQIQLLKSASELKKSNEELEQFAYIASHDLQEPLRAVSSYCQLLKEKEYEGVDEESKKYFDYIINSSFRMKTLIKELLDYSRVGRRAESFEKINLQDLLEEVLSDFHILIEDTGADIIIESSMPNIFAIRFRVKQLLHNIISNSLKFKGDGKPIIRIGCCDGDDSHSWLFYIKDNGIGIDAKYYNRVFGIFKRLYSREEYPGTGIGLALCRKIVEAHGGKIWVESEKGEGTYVYFTIAKSWDIF
jgi:PAS domain S-box-containing protein